MNKFKIGDKVKIKERFWEIENGVYFNDCNNNEMKKLAGRTLEVEFVDSNGEFFTKQDDSNDETRWTWSEDWLEIYNPTITWDNLKETIEVDGYTYKLVKE